MFVANKGTEDEWSCECCDPNGYHHHHDDTCEHVCCGAWAGDEIDNPPHDRTTCSDLMGALQDSLAQQECICMTAADLGFSGWGDGVNPNLIANEHPECPIHGVVPVPRDLWVKVRNIPSDRLPTGTWEAIQAIGRKGVES